MSITQTKAEAEMQSFCCVCRSMWEEK